MFSVESDAYPGYSAMQDFVHGCVKNRSPLTNARTHCKQVSVASIDIRDFYPSVNYNMVYRLWERAGLGTKASEGFDEADHDAWMLASGRANE